MKNYNMVKTEKQHISALSLGKIDKYLADEETLPSDQNRLTEQASFTYTPLGKTLEKQTKTTEDQRRRQINPIMNQMNNK